MIVENGLLGIIDLTKKLYLDKSTISRVVDLLVENGYLNKEVNPKDGRAIMLNVTDKGVKVHQQVEIMEIDDMKQLLSNIDPKVSQKAIMLISELAKKAIEEYQ